MNNVELRDRKDFIEGRLDPKIKEIVNIIVGGLSDIDNNELQKTLVDSLAYYVQLQVNYRTGIELDMGE